MGMGMEKGVGLSQQATVESRSRPTKRK